MKKLAIISTHPIQYNAPLFKLLSQRTNIKIKVFYTWGESVLKKKYDPGFGKIIEWDVPLLEGYDCEFLENTSIDPGSHRFKGIINPHIIQRIIDFKADAILIFGWAFQSHLKCLRYFKGKIPILFRGDSTLLNEHSGIKKYLRKFFLRWVYSHIDYALYVGTNNRLYFEKNGLKDEQLILAPHAIDNDRFSEPDIVYQNQANEWKKKLNIQPNELTILFAGKLEVVKNPMFLVELAAHVKDLPVKFIIVGNGHLEKDIKMQVNESKQFIFLDFQNQSIMPVVYRLGDVFMLCSKSETWGLAANEAMACGCALMLSEKVGGAIDLVQNGKNGIVFGLNDFNKCIRFIKNVLNDRSLLSEMKKKSKKNIMNFSYSTTALAIESICTRL